MTFQVQIREDLIRTYTVEAESAQDVLRMYQEDENLLGPAQDMNCLRSEVESIIDADGNAYATDLDEEEDV